MAERPIRPSRTTLFDQDSTKGVFDQNRGGYVEKPPTNVRALPSPRMRELKALIEQALDKGNQPHDYAEPAGPESKRIPTPPEIPAGQLTDVDVEYNRLNTSTKVGLGLIGAAGFYFVAQSYASLLQF